MASWAAAVVVCLAALSGPGAAWGADRRLTVGILVEFEQQPAPEFLNQVRSEVEPFFRPAGVVLEWHTDLRQGMGPFHRVVRVTARGRCGTSYALQQWPAPDRSLYLGWSVFQDGESTSQVVIDCDRVARVAAQSRHWGQNSLAVYAHYIRLAGRVLAHELLHVLLDSSVHSDSDLNRRVMRLDDLRRQVRLAPGEIEQLRRLATGGAAVARSAPPGR